MSLEMSSLKNGDHFVEHTWLIWVVFFISSACHTVFIVQQEHIGRARLEPVFSLCLSKLVANGRRRYMCIVVIHWLTPCPATERKRVFRWGLLVQFSSVPLFSEFFSIVKTHVNYIYHIYIRQVPPQLICGGTCQI